MTYHIFHPPKIPMHTPIGWKRGRKGGREWARHGTKSEGLKSTDWIIILNKLLLRTMAMEVSQPIQFQRMCIFYGLPIGIVLCSNLYLSAHTNTHTQCQRADNGYESTNVQQFIKFDEIFGSCVCVFFFLVDYLHRTQKFHGENVRSIAWIVDTFSYR